MSTSRRAVRVTQAFFDDLDRALPPDRGPKGEPSSHDFLVHELLRVTEVFATNWYEMPQLVVGRPDYRVLVGSGLLVPRFAAIGHLTLAEDVELIAVHFDLGVDWS